MAFRISRRPGTDTVTERRLSGQLVRVQYFLVVGEEVSREKGLPETSRGKCRIGPLSPRTVSIIPQILYPKYQLSTSPPPMHGGLCLEDASLLIGHSTPSQWASWRRCRSSSHTSGSSVESQNPEIDEIQNTASCHC